MVKQKLFSMPPISVEEAVNALELIDHPFYMFRNKVRRRRRCALMYIMLVYIAFFVLFFRHTKHLLITRA